MDEPESPKLEPEPLLTIPLTLDFQVKILRNISNQMVLCSDEAKFKVKIAVENSFQRDIMALLIR